MKLREVGNMTPVEDDEPTKAQLIADLRQSLHEAATGQTIPAADFMAALDSDDESAS